jgi:hypothetical protein
MDDQGYILGKDNSGIFSLRQRIQTGFGAHPTSCPVGTRGPRRETDHSPSSSAEVKTAWSYTSTPQYVFMASCLVKHRDEFTFMSLCT